MELLTEEELEELYLDMPADGEIMKEELDCHCNCERRSS
ncbi:hypothetical protein PAECIP111890_06272 [Paenibacillus sp. JJ-223]|nr:hypothetical protein PAECIP111890_06272 [Paenibacillus sp. JJ-223]